MTTFVVPIPGRDDQPHGTRRWLLWGAGALAVLAILGWLAPAIALVLLGTVVVAWLAAVPKRAFVALACLLPLHTVTIAVLFGVLGLNENVARAIAAWKECLVLVVFIAMLVRMVTGRGGEARMGWLDLVVATLGTLILGDLFGRQPTVGSEVPLVGQLYGVRDAGLFLLLYYVGRSSASEMATDGVLDILFAVGIATAVIGILERIFVPPQLLAAVGATRYYKEFLNIGVMLTEDEVPMNYFTDIGGRQFARAGSTYLSSQGFALSYLLIMPAATIMLLRRDRRAGVSRWLGYGICWIGLLLTVTRMSIVCVFLEVCLVAWYLHRRGAIVGVLAGFVGVVAVAIAAVPDLGAWLIDTLLFKTGSSEGHIGDWTNGIAALLENPLGSGLATADVTGDRFGATHVTADNLFLKYGVELGFPGLVLLITILLGIGLAARHLARAEDAPANARYFGIWVLAVTAGIVLNGLSTTLFTSQFISYLYFWIGGAVVTIAHTYRRPRGAT